MAKTEYYVGLDVGTQSVGWAVTDTSYKLCKCNGKALWGVRLFDEAQTAVERRQHRTARRRLERQHQRIALLQQMFAEEIGRVDPAFFQRLHESKFREEDKQSAQPLGRYTLFADRNYNDADYYREYKTIYHLRKALIENRGSFDIRLVYLAVHHIMKYRGHFLYGDLSMDAISLDAALGRLNAFLQAEYEVSFPIVDVGMFADTLTARKLNTTQKRNGLLASTGIDKAQEQLYAIVELLAGRTVSLDALFADKVSTEDIAKLCLQSDFDDVEDKLLLAVGDRIELVLAVKEIYDWALLKELLDGEEYLSFAKVAKYEKHRADLDQLKQVIRQTGDKKLYREIFKVARKGLDNYPAYSGKGAANYRCDYDKFRKYLSGKLKKLSNQSAEALLILKELEAGSFLPKQTTKDNGVVPHQLHQAELEKILTNAGARYPFLNEVDESGLSVKERIIRLFCFRVPYYVGPLNSTSLRSWLVRSDEKIYPWNFEQVVDLEKSAEHFITRMTAKCSYIGEAVLPKDSLLYTKFMVLNEINNIKINGRLLFVVDKQAIYNDLFLSGRKVTGKRLRGYLESLGKLNREDELSGFDGDFKATLASWRSFEWLLPRAGGFAAAEDIIKHKVLFGEDRRLFERWLSKTYNDLLDACEQKKVCSMRFSGWGNLSGKFLTEIYHVDRETGEAISLMDALWSTNNNLMELLSSRYTFRDAVEAYRKEHFSCLNTLEAYLTESYASPGIKRAIRQTIAIISEIEKIMQGPPKRIFVEMAREDGEKGKRTVSRKTELIELYKRCGEDANELFELLENTPEEKLRRDKLYLYYTQLGRCLYSWDPIDLERLDTDYDIEHIYPQSKTKDDSLNNRILVKRVLNANKSDTYPIDSEIRRRMRPYWAMLKEKALISPEKYERLIRATPFSTEELAGFINRQLVETRQSTKIVTELLNRRYGGNTEIVYVKAGNVSSFRQDQRLDAAGCQKQAGQCGKREHTVQDPVFVKCREVNDFHHAKDAYLNIVVGNVYHVKFTRNPVNFFKEKAVYSLNRMFDFDVERGGERAWVAGEDGSIAVVRRTMRKNNVLFTRMTCEAKGGLFDQNIVPQGGGQAPIKSSDPRFSAKDENGKLVYGGYNKLSSCYFCLVEHTVKKKLVRSIEVVYLMHKTLYEQDPVRYCEEVLALVSPVVVVRKLPINSLIVYNGFPMHLSGRSSGGKDILFKNAMQLVLAPEWQQYIKCVAKYLERCKAAKKDLPVTMYDGVNSEKNAVLLSLLIDKLEKSQYRVKYATALQNINKCKEAAFRGSVTEQCRFLEQVLHLFSCDATHPDLKAFNGGVTGILTLSKALPSAKEQSVILRHQSITGVFEQDVDLLKVSAL